MAHRAYVGAHFQRLNEQWVLMMTSSDTKLIPAEEFAKGYDSMLNAAQENRMHFIEPTEIMIGGHTT